jgi:hypothetical protein
VKLKLSESDLLQRLAVRFAPPAFAFIPHVSNTTGYRADRHADALAMSVWPSRGVELHGFEVKCDRRDWLRELKAPHKAEAIAKFCDRWWVVVAHKDIVKPGELPAGWGLLAANGTGLRCEVEAPRIEGSEWNRGFVAAIIRRVVEMQAPAGQVEAAKARGYDDGLKANAQRVQYARDELKELQRAVGDFNRRSGLDINRYNGERLGKAVHLVLSGAPDRFRGDLENLKERAENIVERIATELAVSESR